MATHAPITGAPTRATLSGARVYAPPPHLVQAIARLCAAKGKSESSFGREAIGDPGLVAGLRKGRRLRYETNERVLAHMAALAAANPPRVRRRPIVAVTADTLQEAFAQLVDMAPRKDVENAVDMLIERLDSAEPDPDLEDSESGSAVDERGRHLGGEVSAEHDEDREPDDDAQGDTSWTEWHTRGQHKIDRSGAEPIRRPDGLEAHEDDEDDDPETGIEDDPRGCDPEEDRCPAGDDGCGKVGGVWGSDDEEPGAEFFVDSEAYREQRDRIRRMRCYKLHRTYRDWHTRQVVREVSGHRLYRDPVLPSRRALLRRKRGVPRHPRP